jgi:hypothetical protein
MEQSVQSLIFQPDFSCKLPIAQTLRYHFSKIEAISDIRDHCVLSLSPDTGEKHPPMEVERCEIRRNGKPMTFFCAIQITFAKNDAKQVHRDTRRTRKTSIQPECKSMTPPIPTTTTTVILYGQNQNCYEQWCRHSGHVLCNQINFSEGSFLNGFSGLRGKLASRYSWHPGIESA